jgi:hypothetical protein
LRAICQDTLGANVLIAFFTVLAFVTRTSLSTNTSSVTDLEVLDIGANLGNDTNDFMA